MDDDLEIEWPPLPDVESGDPQIELKKLLYQAKLQVITTQQAADLERGEAFRANIYLLDQALHNAYIDVAKGHLDRVRARAEFVEKAAGTIGGAYALVLGLSFDVTKNSGAALPVRGLAPTFFLGLSIVFAAVYHAFITKPYEIKVLHLQGTPSKQIIDERKAFIEWISDIVIARSRWLQTAVISLGFGVIFLPAAFLAIQDIIIWIAVGLALLITLLFPYILSFILDKKHPRSSSDSKSTLSPLTTPKILPNRIYVSASPGDMQEL